MILSNEIQKNPELLYNKNKLKRMILVEFSEDQEKVKGLLDSYNINIIEQLRKCDNKPDQFKIMQILHLIKETGHVTDECVRWCFNFWTELLTPDVLATLDVHFPIEKNVPEVFENKKEQDENSEIMPANHCAAIDNESVLFNPEPSAYKEDDYFVNPQLPYKNTEKKKVYVPCGIGNTDYGFEIYGLEKQPICKNKNADIFALVYNYFIRNTKVSEEDFKIFTGNNNSVFSIDFRSVYRAAILLLQLVKNNYDNDGVLYIQWYENDNIIRYAKDMINAYAALFSNLLKIEPVRLKVDKSRKGIYLSLNSENGIHIKSISTRTTNAREIWFGSKLKYRLVKEDIPVLEKLLSEISPFDSFNEGQFEVLTDMLAASKHCVCIMPTGSGKSLVYYMASILQPLPLFVVAPTDILIQDQIRNLKQFHRIDNVSHLKLTDENGFDNFEIVNSLNYLTPMTLQNRNLLIKFRYINNGTRLVGVHEEKIASGPLAAYIVLDEIHCLSNWGHDFRPEYQMLSRYLNNFLDQINFWGFTATANYTVVEDIQKQLNIPQENFFSPIAFEKYNVKYNFIALSDTNEMYSRVKEIAELATARNERTIVFTKNNEISLKVADAIGYEADVFSEDNPQSYYHFAEEKCKILVASQDLGVGINFPNIKNVIHFGLPLSKNEYIQEIGRAGRANEQVKSYVLYLDNSSDNVPARLLSRDTDINAIPDLLKNIKNDYSDIYTKLTNNSPTKDVMYNDIIKFLHQLTENNRLTSINSYTYADLENAKQKLFMLYTIGVVEDWYTYRKSKICNGIDIFVKNPVARILNMKSHMADYFEHMGDSREAIAKTNRAQTVNDLIYIYVEWYYNKYLYRHNEQFLDLFEFIDGNAHSADDKVTDSIKDFFTLPFVKLKEDEARYLNMSFNSIIRKALTGIGKESIANLERINSNHYSYKLDFMLFCSNLRFNNEFEEDRLNRLLGRVTKNEQAMLFDALHKIYVLSDNVRTRLSFLKYIEKNYRLTGITVMEFLEKVYADSNKDFIYYSLLSQKINKIFVETGR